MTVVGRLMTATLVVAGSIALGGGTALAQTSASLASNQSTQSALTPAHAALPPAYTALAQTQTRNLARVQDGQITSPSDGQVVSGGSVSVSARTRMGQLSMGLYVEGPSTPRQKVASGGPSQTISGTFDAGDAPNGTFSVTLKGEITGSVYETTSFKLRRPASAPNGVSATLQGSDKVVVTWSKGDEPDLQSYEIATTQSGTVGKMSADQACGGGSCKATLAVPSKAAGHRVGFTVKAFRSDGDGGSIGSGNSGAAYVKVPAPPAAKPTTKKSATPTSKPQDTKTGVDELPTIPGKKKSDTKTTPTGKITTPKNDTKLPAMPETDKDGNLPLPSADEQAKDDGLTPSAEQSQAPAPADSQVKAQSSESPLGSVGQYGLYVAGGLILLLLAGHVGAWARRRSLATAGGGPALGGSATRGGGPNRGGGPARVGGGTSAAAAAMLPDGPQPGDSIPPTTTAPRRPAVVLAVAKTRAQSGEQPRVPEQQRPSERIPSERIPSERIPSERIPSEQRPFEERPFEQDLSEQHSSEPRPSQQQRRSEQPGLPEPPRIPEPATALPLYLSADDMRTAQNQADAARQEPLRIALPSSAVTVMPESSTPAPAVRLEDRWDDYLPPTPRAMEDSGFWERPQPGDFWTPDERTES